MITDASGRSHVYNAVTLDLGRALTEMVASGVSAVRLDFTTEEPAEQARVVRAYRASLDEVGRGQSPTVTQVVAPATSGHFFRGVR